MPVVVEVGELVAPLGHYAQRILEEGNDNQESTNCGQITGYSVSHPALNTALRAEETAQGAPAALTA